MQSEKKKNRTLSSKNGAKGRIMTFLGKKMKGYERSYNYDWIVGDFLG